MAACRLTASATLPIHALLHPVRPCDVITMRSAEPSPARSPMAFAGSPLTTANDVGIPEPDTSSAAMPRR